MIASMQMAAFGWLYVDADLAEVSKPKDIEVPQSVAINFDGWADTYGYRLYSRKAAAVQYFSSRNLKYNNEKAFQIIRTVLTLSPFEPSYWLQLSRLALLNFDDMQVVISYLRMSYLTGRSVSQLMPSRVSLSVALWPALEDSDKALAANDLIFAVTTMKQDIGELIGPMSAVDRAEFIKIIKMRDAKIADQLTAISESQTQ